MQPDATQLLIAIQAGDRQATGKLLPLVYDELRRLAAAKLHQERPGQTLQATALVHEAYLRLVSDAASRGWDGRGHFFGAAAEAMRRILIDQARAKASLKRGGMSNREPLDGAEIAAPETEGFDLLDLDAALERLAATDADAAQLVKLRYFAGLPMEQAADAMQISPRAAYYLWTYARSWLRKELGGG